MNLKIDKTMYSIGIVKQINYNLIAQDVTQITICYIINYFTQAYYVNKNESRCDNKIAKQTLNGH